MANSHFNYSAPNFNKKNTKEGIFVVVIIIGPTTIYQCQYQGKSLISQLRSVPHIGLFVTAKVTRYYDCPILRSMTGNEEAHTTLIGNPVTLMEWSYQISKRGDRNAEATEPRFANYIPPYSCQVSMYIPSHEYNYRIFLSVKISYYHSLKGN